MSDKKDLLKQKTPDPIWDSKTVGEEYGILGETHQEFEKTWIKEWEKASKHGETSNPFSADKYQFREKKAFHDYDSNLYRKLSGLYSVLGSIQKADTVVTADMISKDTYQKCKASYGISKKELKRLVSDAQQGRVPDFSIRETHTSTRDSGNVAVAGTFQITRNGQRTDEPGIPLTEDQQNVRILRELEAEAVRNDPDLSAAEIEQALQEYGKMTDIAFLAAIRRRYGNQRPPEWETIIQERSRREVPQQETARRHHVTVSMHSGLARVSSVSRMQKDTLSGKVMSGKDAQKKAGAQELARLLAEKRAAAGRRLKPWQAITLSEAEVKDFQKKYGISKKDLEKLSMELQSGKAKGIINPPSAPAET